MAILFKNLRYQIISLFPLFLLFFISLNNFSVIELKNFKFFFINFQYIIIYYWVLKKPKTLGYGFIFLAGIITDVVLGLPMGISSLSYLVIAMLATYTRIVTVRISLLTDWLTFIPALLAANLIYFIVLYFYNIPIDYLNLLSSSFFTFIAYPFLWFVFELLRKTIRGAGNA